VVQLADTCICSGLPLWLLGWRAIRRSLRIQHSEQAYCRRLVSSMAPLDNPEITRDMHGLMHVFFSLERHLPPLARFSCRLMCTTWRSNPDLYFKAQLNGLYNTKEAQTMLPMMKAMLTADLLEAVRDGTNGITWDLEILAQPWGFPLHVIPTDVFLWHGENDTQAPLAMGNAWPVPSRTAALRSTLERVIGPSTATGRK